MCRQCARKFNRLGPYLLLLGPALPAETRVLRIGAHASNTTVIPLTLRLIPKCSSLTVDPPTRRSLISSYRYPFSYTRQFILALALFFCYGFFIPHRIARV